MKEKEEEANTHMQHNFITYLQSMLTDDQIDVLARNLGKNPICFYGTGLGKSTLVEMLHKAWFKNTYAPEDCRSDASCMSVLNREGTIALCMKNEPFCTLLLNDSFSRDEIIAGLEAFLKRER